MKIKPILIVLLVPLLFFFFSLATLKDYGISWDEPIHFYRGQAYLHFFLTGKKDFADIEKKSYYQNDTLTARDFIEGKDGGHPPINGILSALFNYFFFQNLKALGDIEAHHLFTILSSTLAVMVVGVFAYQKLGILGSVVAGLSLATYPLFFAEGHFNVKDPVETAFFATTIWTFWMSLRKGSWKWLLFSAICFALALGTKFNALFLLFIIGPYLVIRYFEKFKSGWRIPKAYLLTLLVSPLVVTVIFVGSWPYLWGDPVANFLKIVGFYQDIGIRHGYQLGYFSNGVNLYPSLWILITTPPWVLFLSTLGIFVALRRLSKDKTELLWLLWLLIPIARVSLPNTAIYGGVRHIMEFIPALSLLAGLGAYYLQNLFKNRYKLLISLLILVGFIPHIFIMSKLHPNENVYFNSFIGGIKGAKEKNVPYVGNSMGNAYLQAIKWLNINAPLNSHLVLIQGTSLNIPKLQLRGDIEFWNDYWSGIERKGEFVLELTFTDHLRPYPYAWDYVERFLDPVYEVKVDGVAIAKVWKNDLEHTKKELNKKEILYPGIPSFKIGDSLIEIDTKEKVVLTRMVIGFSQNTECLSPKGRILTSLDSQNWHEESERFPIPYSQVGGVRNIEENKMTYFFAGKEARYIMVEVDNPKSCLLQNPNVSLYILEQ